MRGAMGRSKKQQSKKNKIDLKNAKIEEKEKISKISKQKINEEDEDIFFQKEEKIPKTWKDSWQRPLNQSVTYSEPPVDRIKTDTRNKRQNNKRSEFLADMINIYE